MSIFKRILTGTTVADDVKKIWFIIVSSTLVGVLLGILINNL